MTFPEAVANELTRARRGHRDIRSMHEGYAVILEEVRELERAVFHRSSPVGEIAAELVQVAAMCQRFAEDLELLDVIAAGENMTELAKP